MIIYLLLIVLTLAAFHIYVRYNRVARLVDKIPGPTPLPLIGNSLIGYCSSEELWTRLRKLSNSFYPVLRIWWPTFPVVILRHPDDIKILTACETNIEKSHLAYENLSFAGGHGLLSSGGNKWHFRRDLLNPAFSRDVLKNYTDIVNDHVETFIKNIKSQGDQVKQELEPVCKKLAMGIIFESTMGYNLNKMRIGCRRKQVLVDTLLYAEKDGLINHEEILSEITSLVIAGYPTVTAAALFTLLVLADNKEAQDLARKEVLNVLGANKDNKVTAAQLQKMEYLDRCLKESLRLFPSSPFFGRLITKDIQLKHCFIPAGIQVIVDIYALHRDPNFWPEPDKFDPDRFLPKNTQSRHSHAFMPFSSGLRNCIGQNMAMQELKLFISRILYNFYLEPVNRIADLIIKTHLTLKTLHPTYVKFVKRNQ